jgi:hypothetical protein
MTHEAVWTQGGFLMLEEFKSIVVLVWSVLSRPKRVVLNAEACLDQVRATSSESERSTRGANQALFDSLEFVRT